MAARAQSLAGSAAVAAALVVVVVAVVLLAAPSAGADRGTVTCSGAIEGSSFHFSCDGAVGGNSLGWLFAISSSRVSGATVSSPGGVSCAGHSRRILCKGPTIPAGTRIAGSLTIAGGGEGEEEGEHACSGEVSAAVTVYGAETSGEELEEGEGPAALPEGRFGLSSCRTQEEGEGGGSLSFGKVKLNRKAGTALLPVNVPGAGTVTLTGKGIVKVSKPAKAAGTVRLTVKPRGKAKRKLHETGKATVGATVAFAPARGQGLTKAKKIVLRFAGAR